MPVSGTIEAGSANASRVGDEDEGSDGDLYEEVHSWICAIPACSIIFVGETSFEHTAYTLHPTPLAINCEPGTLIAVLTFSRNL